MSEPKRNPKDRFSATIDDFGDSVMEPTEAEIEKIRAESSRATPDQAKQPPPPKPSEDRK